MKLFYKISKETAQMLGKIALSSYEGFDPFVGKQKDGNYLISPETYEKLQNHVQFQKVDWSGIIKITEKEAKENLYDPDEKK